ncbi:MAG: helix-turn-helix transcriptional regulator, partial [archaeon]|nr:helix-turn-helix transcriptional regulator [archaeon]
MMSKKSDQKDIKSFLLRSSEEISEIIKVVSHKKRLEILALLMISSQKFIYLQKRTELSKTALSNHLNLLFSNNLISKSERGIYFITELGLDLAEFSAIFYNKVLSQNELRIKSIQNQYSKAFQKLPKKNRITFEINNTPIYQGCWNSYLGAISGVLKSFGYDYDINAVGGYS